MTQRTRVRRPDAHADRPQPLLLIAIALGALMAGLGAARGLRLTERTRSQPDAVASSARPPARLERPPATGVSPTKHRPQIDLDAATSEPAPSAPRASDAVQASAMQTSTLPKVHDRVSLPEAPIHFERRFVAYVRCDGLPQVEGRFPCPRDPRLETRVWGALAALEGCDLATTARGEGELRLDFKRFGVPTLRFEAVEHGSLDREAVTQCAGQSLSPLHTSLRPEHMVVAFRFELR